MFLSMQSVQTVRAVSLSEMAQREEVRGGGRGCRLTASYARLFWRECLDPSYVLHALENVSGQHG